MSAPAGIFSLNGYRVEMKILTPNGFEAKADDPMAIAIGKLVADTLDLGQRLKERDREWNRCRVRDSDAPTTQPFGESS